MFWKAMLFLFAVPVALIVLASAAWQGCGGEPLSPDSVGGQVTMLACQLVGLAMLTRAAVDEFEDVGE